MRIFAVCALTLALALCGDSARAVQDHPPETLQDEARKACGVAAMTDYIKENLALMQTGTPFMSVQALIAQRRLEEQYCLRSTKCLIGDGTSMMFAVAFNSCLSDESLEKYDAEPRDR